MTSIRWLEMEIQAPAERAPALQTLLERRSLGGWVIEEEEPVLRWVFYVPMEGGWQERLGSLAVALEGQGATLRSRSVVADQDWAEAWKAFYHPRRLTRTLVVRPSWEDYTPAPGERVITLDPGMAFGTGYHASTVLCLELLEEAPAGESVLDLGTGSGILAIAALLLGSARVLAVDCDPVAVRTARQNLAANGLSGRARVVLYDGPPPGQYHLILANLVAAQLVELAPALASGLWPGGRLVAGGIVEERAAEVEEALVAAGLTLEERRSREGWVGLRWVR